jgi:GTPase SAR1 family protein
LFFSFQTLKGPNIKHLFLVLIKSRLRTAMSGGEPVTAPYNVSVTAPDNATPKPSDWDIKHGPHKMEKEREVKSHDRPPVTVGIFGQPRTGKSFLLNCILGRYVFEHRMSAQPVTTSVSSYETNEEYAEAEICPTSWWNVQGFGELAGANADRNRHDWSSVFSRSPRLVAICLLQHQNGRLRVDDIELFMQLKTVYNLHPSSTIVLFNQPPSSVSAANRPAWFDRLKMTFCAITAFNVDHFATIHHVPRSATGEFDFSCQQARLNALLVRDRLKGCIPREHPQTGVLRLSEETRVALRLRIAEIEKEIQRAMQEHEGNMRALQAAIQQLQAQSAALEQERIRQQQEHERQMRSIQAVERDNERRFTEAMAAIQAQMDAIAKADQEYRNELAQMQVEYAKARKDSKNIGKILKAVGKTFIKKPLIGIVAIGSMIAVPLATPVLATTLGIGTVPTAMGLGAACGVANAAVSHQNIATAGLAGMVTAGMASYASPLAMAPRLALNAGAAATGAAMTKTNPLAAVAGSAAGGLLQNFKPIQSMTAANAELSSRVAGNAAIGAISSAASGAVRDPSVGGIVGGAAQGALSGACAAAASVIPPLTKKSADSKSRGPVEAKSRGYNAGDAIEGTSHVTRPERCDTVLPNEPSQPVQSLSKMASPVSKQAYAPSNSDPEGGSTPSDQFMSGMKLVGKGYHALKHHVGPNILSTVVSAVSHYDGSLLKTGAHVVVDKAIDAAGGPVVAVSRNVATIIDTPAMRTRSADWSVKAAQEAAIANDPNTSWYARMGASEASAAYLQATTIPNIARALTQTSDCIHRFVDEGLSHPAATFQQCFAAPAVQPAAAK